MQRDPRYKRIHYRAGFIGLTLLLALIGPLAAQQAIDRDAYLANRPGDSIALHNMMAGDTFSIVLRADRQDTSRYRRIIAGIGSWTFRQTAAGDHYLESIELAGGWSYRFEQPLAWAPAQFQTWQSFSRQSAFTAYWQGQKRGGGVFSLEINAQNKDSARTPFRNFGDCIVLIVEAQSTGSNCPKLTYSFKEWHARDIGLVKLAGHYTLEGLQTETTRIASNLIGARLGGQALEGRK